MRKITGDKMRYLLPLILSPILCFGALYLYRQSVVVRNAQNAPSQSGGRWILALFLGFFIAYAGTFLHKTGQYLGKAPIATDDDSIANVAVNLWQNQEYGFPASPTLVRLGQDAQPLLQKKHFDGTHDYYNYGWLYFAVAGFFNWATGDSSLLFFRLFNAWSILGISLAAIFLFRKESLLPGAIVAAVVGGRFLSSVAPIMARPDIAVSIGATLFFVFAYYAIRKENFVFWLLAGFWAATASTSHLVAWTISLAAFVTWLIYGIFAATSAVNRKNTFAGLVTGGLFGIFLYLFCMNFRIFELWKFVSFLSSHLQHPSFREQLMNGVRSAWTGADLTFSLGITGVIASVFLLIAASRIDRETRKNVFSYLAAPVFVNIFYLFSLGFYRSLLHPAYGILLYVSSAWLLGGSLAVFLMLFRKRYPHFAAAKNLGNLAGAGILALMTVGMFYFVPHLQKQSFGWIDFTKYEEKVFETIPDHSSVWGALNLGIKSGSRTQHLDSSVGFAFLLHHPESSWTNLAPNYFVFDYFTLQSYFFSGPAKGQDNPLWILSKLSDENMGYQLSRIVYAPPYGNTFIFAKNSLQAAPLSLAYNNGLESHWLLNKTNPTTIALKDSKESLVIDSQQMNGQTAQANQTVRSELPAGVYLIEFEVEPSSVPEVGAVVVTNSPYFYLDGETRLPQTPILRSQNSTALIYPHSGGEIFFSFFSGRAGLRGKNGTTIFKKITVSSLGKEYSVSGLTLPSFNQWEKSPNIQQLTTEDGATKLSGKLNPSTEYLPVAASPWIKISKRKEYLLKIRGQNQGSPILVEIQNRKSQSLLYGEKKNYLTSIGFQSLRSDEIKIQLWAKSSQAFANFDWRLHSAELIGLNPNINSIRAVLSCASSAVEDKNCKNVDDSDLKKFNEELAPIR